jgi:hypothetical protein
MRRNQEPDHRQAANADARDPAAPPLVMKAFDQQRSPLIGCGSVQPTRCDQFCPAATWPRQPEPDSENSGFSAAAAPRSLETVAATAASSQRRRTARTALAVAHSACSGVDFA